MGRVHAGLMALNRGEVSKHALGRVDLDRLRLSAEEQVNFIPYALGPMTLRPGLAYIGGVKSDLATRLVPFIFSNSDTALVELTNLVARIWIGDTVLTRSSVSTTVTNGDFSSSTGWTTSATDGTTATISGGKLTLTCTARGGLTSCVRSVTVAGGDQATEHGLRIIVDRGPVLFKCGTTSGGDDLITKTSLGTGEHSLSFTPGTGTIYVYFESTEPRQIIVDSIQIESSGAVELPTPWTTALLPLVRFDQSGDIIFVACYGKQQRKIERRATRSWSVVKYETEDGPFRAVAGGKFKMTPGERYGNTTLTAERPHFTSSHVGTQFRLFSPSQNKKAVLGALDATTDAIRVTGVGNDRRFTINTTGTWTGTIKLQRSFDGDDSGFTDVETHSWTTNQSNRAIKDGLDNSIVWYRIKFTSYTSGSVTVTFDYGGGGDHGICRVTGYTSSTVVDIEVLSPFSSRNGTFDWQEGEWSDEGTWPSAVRFHDGRLWWAGGDKLWGSVSDSYYSFAIISDDTDEVQDDSSINRSVGFGPIDIINDLQSVGRLIALREGSELSVRSSSLDEPITPTNFTLKDCSTQGSDRLSAAKIDSNVVFVQKSGRRVYELVFSADRMDYVAHDLTRLNLDIGDDGFECVAVSRQPDTFVWMPRGDGRMAALLYEKEDQVEAWCRIETADTTGGDCYIEEVAVLPGTLEDAVYCVVKRVIGGSTKRFIEKFARRDQCLGQPEARLADSHIIWSGAASTTITGLSHLNGETVTVWGWNTSSPFTVTLPDGSSQTVGRDLGTYTVSGGSITVSTAVTNACVGLVYEGRFKSAKLAYGGMLGTAVNQVKTVDQIGLVLLDTHHDGLTYGQDYDHQDDLPQVEEGASVSTHTIWATYDKPTFKLNGTWNTDSRLCLKATAPRPCTVSGVTFALTTVETP